MTCFSSKEGYKPFEDAIPTLHRLHSRSIYTALVSNADTRMRSVLRDLEFPAFLHPIVLSEEEGIEKPSPEIFLRALHRVNTEIALQGGRDIAPAECLHVGDEILCDYHGARNAGMNALLLQRPGENEEPVHDKVNAIKSLEEIS